MTLGELIFTLSMNPVAGLNILLPDGSTVPAHFHVTEIGRVQKDFIDCGGTPRNSETCVLQVWVANDIEHRLQAGKLSKIIQLGRHLFPSLAIPVEVEYDTGVISQYPLVTATSDQSTVVLQLASKHTACLAPDLCGVDGSSTSSCCGPDCC